LQYAYEKLKIKIIFTEFSTDITLVFFSTLNIKDRNLSFAARYPFTASEVLIQVLHIRLNREDPVTLI
jgi:hypothetical protein